MTMGFLSFLPRWKRDKLQQESRSGFQIKFGMTLLMILIFGFWISSSVCAAPQRIISTMPSITETLFALGLGDKVVGVTTLCNYPEAAKKKEKIGGMYINLEKIISLSPTLIVMLDDAQPHDIWKLKARHLPVVTINPHNVDETIDSIVSVGSYALVTPEARRLAGNLRYRLQIVNARNKNKANKDVFAMVGYKPLVSVGAGTFIDDIIIKAGGNNIISGKVSYPQVSFEELYKLNPEFIIIPEGLLSSREVAVDSKLSRLTAVQNGKILFINPDILSRPGPRVVDAVEEISRFIENEE